MICTSSSSVIAGILVEAVHPFVLHWPSWVMQPLVISVTGQRQLLIGYEGNMASSHGQQ